MKRILLSSVAVFAFAAAGHADELSDIQAQSKQLREQNQALMKRLTDLEKRQQKLEQQPAQAQAAARTVNPTDAMAADLPYKAYVKAPVAPVDNGICWHGVCLYGDLDMGVSYQNHGAPLSALAGAPLDYSVQKTSNGSYFGAGPNQMSTSFIGLKGKQEIADNLYAVFNLQTLFNPASGMNANGTGSLVQNNGYGAAGALPNANAYGDSSKAGQMFNNAAYFGLSSPTYGTFTMGRQSALTSDLVVNYDPISGSNAFSIITYEGATGGGGDTEDRVLDNSFEYRLNVGPVRLAAIVQAKNGGNSSTGNIFQGNVGFDYMGLSMDVVGGKSYDANAVGTTMTAANVATVTAAGTQCSLGCLSGTISDNTYIQVAARYTIGQWKLYGGYEYIDYADPNNPLTPGAFAVGGYNIGIVNNTNYLSDKHLQIFWAGVKYAVTPTLDIVGAYYGERQNSFINATNPTGSCATAISSACSGALDAASFVIDWRFARQFDLYAGFMYSQKTNGFANGFILTATNPAVAATYNTNNKVSAYDPGIGLRYQF